MYLAGHFGKQNPKGVLSYAFTGQDEKQEPLIGLYNKFWTVQFISGTKLRSLV